MYYHAGKSHRQSSVTCTWDHFQLKRRQPYASAIGLVDIQECSIPKARLHNYPEVVALQENIKSAKNL